MPNKKMPEFFINAFYESKFKDNFFVVKAGGKIIEDDKARDNLIRNIKDLTHRGIKVLLIYGGGRAMDEAAETRGIKVKKHEGRRITDKATIDMMREVIGGDIALRVYESIAAHKLEGLSFNAVPADWLKAILRAKKPVDFGFVGDITGTKSRPIKRLFRSVDFVAVPCLAWAKESTKSKKSGMLVNINADTIATEIAIGLKADKLIFMSDVDGVLVNSETQHLITTGDIPKLIKDGTATGGMQIKLENCARALNGGVRRIHMINGLRKDALEREIYEPVGPSTMLINESESEAYENEIAAQKLIETQSSKKQKRKAA